MGLSRLTVYLLRGVGEPGDALADDKSYDSIPLDAGFGTPGAFYYTRRPPSMPAWVSYVRPILAADAGMLTTSSASGLLVIEVEGRFFAFTFGYGRSLLDRSRVEHQFGLRVALNRIDPSQIRSLDTKAFEDMVVAKKTQVSKSAELPVFGIDVSRDILRAVTGEPADPSLAKRLSGSHALVLNLKTPPAHLPALCKKLLEAHGDTAYKSNFQWIDHLSLVADPQLIARLDQAVAAQLRQGDATGTHMATPESLDWEDVDAFKISGTRGQEYDDLDLEEYLARLGGDCGEITVERLKSRHVSIRFSRASDFDSRWTVYQCLVAEQRLDSSLYVLIEGQWFAISDSLVSERRTSPRLCPVPTLT